MPAEPGSINDKFLQARRYHRPPINQKQMGELLGLAQTTVSAIENGTREANTHVERAARILNIPIDWWYDGRPGPPPFPSVPTEWGSALGSAPPAPSNNANYDAYPGVGRRKFPLVGTAGCASFPLASEDSWPGDFVEFSDDLFRPERYAIRLRGDSMEPRFAHGDFILVQPSPHVEHGLVGVAHNGDWEYVAKVFKIAPDGTKELHPLNQDYPVLFTDEDWRLVGYAVGWRREKGQGRYIEEGDNAGLRP